MSGYNVSVYTTHQQTEQPAIVHHVTALSLVGKVLLMECDVQERDHTYIASHRFEGDAWTRVEIANLGGSS